MLIRALLALAAALLAVAVFVVAGLPPRSAIRALALSPPGQTAVMREREAQARARGRRPRRLQTWVPLAKVSRPLIQAVLATEDQKFFGHEGVDWQALRESAETNVREGRSARGGSTITQQLAKNLFFTTEKSLVRKARELIVARWLEEDLSKNRILTLYLNVIEWGDGLYGCEAAARAYFGKACGELSVEEAAGLAGIIPSPRRLNPQASPARYERAKRRALRLMTHAGYVERSVAGLGREPEPEIEPDEADPDGPDPTPGS